MSRFSKDQPMQEVFIIQFFVDKLRAFRSYGPDRTQEAIEAWWKRNVEPKNKGRNVPKVNI